MFSLCSFLLVLFCSFRYSCRALARRKEPAPPVISVRSRQIALWLRESRALLPQIHAIFVFILFSGFAGSGFGRIEPRVRHFCSTNKAPRARSEKGAEARNQIEANASRHETWDVGAPIMNYELRGCEQCKATNAGVAGASSSPPMGCSPVSAAPCERLCSGCRVQ